MVDVQLSGVAPTGGATTAAIPGPGAATPVGAAGPVHALGGSTAPSVAGRDTAGETGAATSQPAAAHAGGILPKVPKLDDLEVKDAVKNANQALAAIGTQLVFVFDDQAHHLSVKLLDIQTQKVVQQVPAAAMYATASALSGPSASGALVDTKA